MRRNDINVTTPICDFVGQYQRSGIARFHMPGHKGVNYLGIEHLDVTEIKGADALYEADGIIAESEANATRIFGTARTVYSTEGSSQCIKTMLHMAVSSTGRKTILAARNVHKSFVYGAALCDVAVEWLYNTVDLGICACIVTAKQVEEKLQGMLKENRLPAAVYLTSPDYLGNLQDVAGISEVCHKHGVMLLVDNAHGAYLHFLENGRHPIDYGADMCCDSAHKTLPVLTGGAYLHISHTAINSEWLVANIKNVMAIYGSTSPSYLILQSLDMCNKYLADGYRDKLSACTAKLEKVRDGLSPYVINTEDKLKLTLHIPGVKGMYLAEMLRKQGAECEFADKDYMVLMLTPDSDMSSLDKLYSAVDEVLAKLTGKEAPDEEGSRIVSSRAAVTHKQKMTIRQAVFATHRIVALEDSVGMVCATPVVACPPAIPIVISGEVIEESDIDIFKAYGITNVEVVAM